MDLKEEGLPDNLRGRTSQPRVEAMRAEIFQAVRVTILPRAIWDTFSIASSTPGHVKVAGTWDLSYDTSITTLDGCSEIIAGICTAGAKLDDLIGEYQKISMSKAVMLDQVSTWAIQQVMILVLGLIKKSILEKASRLTPVIRPGFEKWPILNQVGLFSMLDASKIGVRLTSSLLMVPSKSISFIIGILK
nr:hypothetical protein [Candidatus Sigynarchaeota archaeon]